MPHVSLTRRASLALLAPALVLPATKVIGQDLPTIRVVGPANDGMKPVWYAMRSGIFRRYNVNVESSTVNSGSAAIAAMVGGSAEIAYTNLLAVFQGYLRGVPIQIVAPSALYLKEKPQSAMVVLNNSPLRTGKDVNGKTFSSPSVKDLNEAVMRAWVDKNGGDSKTMRIVEIPASSSLPALEEGRIDVATMYEPALTQALLTGRVRVLGRQFEAVGDRFQQTAFAGLGTYIDRNREAMSRFARAMHESTVYTNTHLPETVDLVASYTGVTPEVIAKSVRFIDPEYAEARNIQPMLDICFKYGAIDRAFSAEEVISPVAVKPPARR
jgi:ABC-type nitrate/sulfonate/bicarbonate transport system substrate-binding protein